MILFSSVRLSACVSGRLPVSLFAILFQRPLITFFWLSAWCLLPIIVNKWKSGIFRKIFIRPYLRKLGQKFPKKYFILFFDKSCHLIFVKVAVIKRLYCYFFNLNTISGKILALKLSTKIFLSNQIAGFF